MTTIDNIAPPQYVINKNTVVDLDNKEEVEAAAAWLDHALDFGPHTSDTAIFHSKGNVNDAAEYLASGKWRRLLLISWNYASMRKSCDELEELTGMPSHLCMEVLKDCSGNKDLAVRKLACLPALP